MKKLYKRETFSDRSSWLRSRGFGGSSASAILGVNPWMSALELYNSAVKSERKKWGKQNDEKEKTESMEYGTMAEPLIRKMYRIDHPEWIIRDPRSYAMYRRTDKPYLTATLDGTIYDPKTKRKGILEIKTHDIRNRADDEYWQGSIPQNYLIQVLHYLMVMNDYTFAVLCAKLRFYSYSEEDGRKLAKTEFRYYFIERSEVKNEIAYLEKKETEFYENNVQKRIPPSIEVKF